jgi:hypothetical protein
MLLSPHKYTIGPDEVQDARNYLIFLTNYENVNRAGPVSEIKLSKLREGIKDGDKWTAFKSLDRRQQRPMAE